MAPLRTGAALPFSSSTSSRKYQVFLSFRGKDTRKNFTDHLYTALVQAEIHTFKDEHELERGKNIADELQKAIQESDIAVIIFSKNYAQSKWCLNELVGIMNRNKTTGLIVIPVFYHVWPSHVRSQLGSFGKAFSKHEECESKEKIDGWRAALREVAGLGGMVLQNEADGYESQFIQEIVHHIESNLKETPVINSSLNPFVNPTQLVRSMLTWVVPHLPAADVDLLTKIIMKCLQCFFSFALRRIISIHTWDKQYSQPIRNYHVDLAKIRKLHLLALPLTFPSFMGHWKKFTNLILEPKNLNQLGLIVQKLQSVRAHRPNFALSHLCCSFSSRT